MKKSLGFALILAVLVSLAFTTAVAQDTRSEPRKKAQAESGFYKLDFIVRELEDGKTVNTRNYTLMARTGEWQQLRVGTRVPVTTKDTNVSWQDLGFNLDCRILGQEENAALITKAEIASFATDGEKTGPNGAPLIRQVQMNASAPLTIGKSVVLSAVDELSSKHRFQLEVIATRAK
jgi:hypothetical protein